MKKYLVAWSGGLDSTAMIYKLLEQGHSVRAVYIELSNNMDKSRREKRAISQLMPLFAKNENFQFDGYHNTFNYDTRGSVIGFNQVLPWLTGLAMTIRSDETAAIGYIMNDDAISYLPEIRNIWKSFKGIGKSSSFPKIEFPVHQDAKRELLRMVPSQYRRFLTTCESMTTIGVDPNCNCLPCKKSFFLLNQSLDEENHLLFLSNACDRFYSTKADVDDEVKGMVDDVFEKTPTLPFLSSNL